MNTYIFLIITLLIRNQSYSQIIINNIKSYLINKSLEFIEIPNEYKNSIDLKNIITYSISNKYLLSYKYGPRIYSNILVFKIRNIKSTSYYYESSFSNPIEQDDTITTKDIPLLYAKFENENFNNLTYDERKERLMKNCNIYIFNEKSKLWERLMKKYGDIFDISQDGKIIYFQTKKYGIFGIGCREFNIHIYLYALLIIFIIVYI